MSFTPRLVALDIDGTLYANVRETGVVEEVISAPVYDAVQRVVDAGVHVVLSTGRSAFGIGQVWDQLDLPRDGAQVLGVASNGSVVLSYPPIDVLSTITFDARDLVTRLMEHVPDAAVAVEDVGVGYRLNRPFPEGEISGSMCIEPLADLVAEPVTRVIVRDPHSSEEDFVELAEKLGLHGTNYFIGWTAWLDLSPEGVSKASGLEDVCGRLGVDRCDVLALGDGRNDIEMLRWAGRGVAMGQAPLEVQEAADDVTKTVFDDGVAHELARWF